MKNKLLSTSIIVLISVIAISTYIITTTYGLVVNVKKENGIAEIVDNIKVRDLLIDNQNNYNSIYYQIKDELNITNEEANILIDSEPINKAFKKILNSLVDYRINKNDYARLSNIEILELITNSVNDTEYLNKDIKDKVIYKSTMYIKDINNYLYDVDTNIINNE